MKKVSQEQFTSLVPDNGSESGAQDNPSSEVCTVENPAGTVNAANQLIDFMIESEKQAATIDDELAMIEPAASVALDGPVCMPGDIIDTATLDLNEIEPAAGPGGGTSGARSGYGFQSSAQTVSLEGLAAIGAIGATSLEYDANFLQPRGLNGDIATDNPEVTPSGPALSISINNGANNLLIKEDHTGTIPVSASYNGNAGDNHLVLTVSGIDPSWTVTAPGWTSMGNGVYMLTLPDGQTVYNGAFTFTPPADSDVDMTGLNFNASLQNDTGDTVLTTDKDFSVIVDAVVDTPVLTAPDNIHQNWYVSNTSYNTPLNIASYVADADGSEVVEKIVIRLNEPFTNPNPPYATLDDMGIGLNKGTETSPGVWEIIVNNGDTAEALDDLMLVVPGNMNYQAIHQSVTGSHGVDIPVISHVSETNLNGQEFDLSDNATTVEQNIHLNFTITPLVLDLNGNGIDLVTIEAGVIFDMNNDGVLDQTSWVGSNDGLLAIDANRDGLINNQSELFGNNAEHSDGFKNLAQYDDNGDGHIDVNDTIFNDLVVWKDLNQDGVSQAEEKFSLADLDIASINLDSKNADYTIGDSTIVQESNFTYENGETGQIVDAAFSVRPIEEDDDVQHSIDTFVYEHDAGDSEIAKIDDDSDAAMIAAIDNSQNMAMAAPVDSQNASIM